MKEWPLQDQAMTAKNPRGWTKQNKITQLFVQHGIQPHWRNWVGRRIVLLLLLGVVSWSSCFGLLPQLVQVSTSNWIVLDTTDPTLWKWPSWPKRRAQSATACTVQYAEKFATGRNYLGSKQTLLLLMSSILWRKSNVIVAVGNHLVTVLQSNPLCHLSLPSMNLVISP